MFSKNFWIAMLTGGIAVNLLDIIVRGGFLKEIFVTQATELRTDINPVWFVLFGFLKIVIFVWFFYKTRGSFGGGARGGMKFGLYYGIALNVPAMFFPYMVYRGVPFFYIWLTITYGIVWALLLGVIVGKVSDWPYRKDAPDPLQP
ncbi:MAG: hypothetical protein AB1728_15620 [Bacteroidota bacterium]